MGRKRRTGLEYVRPLQNWFAYNDLFTREIETIRRPVRPAPPPPPAPAPPAPRARTAGRQRRTGLENARPLQNWFAHDDLFTRTIEPVRRRPARVEAQGVALQAAAATAAKKNNARQQPKITQNMLQTALAGAMRRAPRYRTSPPARRWVPRVKPNPKITKNMLQTALAGARRRRWVPVVV